MPSPVDAANFPGPLPDPDWLECGRPFVKAIMQAIAKEPCFPHLVNLTWTNRGEAATDVKMWMLLERNQRGDAHDALGLRRNLARW